MRIKPIIKKSFPFFILAATLTAVFNRVPAQGNVTVSIYGDSLRRPVSPYIYGKNNSISDNTADPLTAAEWQKWRDAGIKMFRENGGNNATKYNWRRKLSSHPDWYNNVYPHDWSYAALRLGQNIPDAQGMWAFQLVGKVAKSKSANFNDWDYNRSQAWAGTNQNLAGGGTVNQAGGDKALVEGNPDLYLENWPADSTVAILDNWFGPGGLGLDSTRIRYWSMDNEPEIWNGTHDDVVKTQPSAETFMQLYFDVAKKARAKFPGIKLVGPVPANEWQWFNWNGGKINYNGKSFTWLEYFILRVAEEQQATGIKLLDVLDIHFYPGEGSPEDIVQLHRVYFDRTYDYPGANGVSRLGASGWDASITKEYIFGRCADWMDQYMGPNHGITFGVSETGINDSASPIVTAIWYASTLGEFAKQGVEVFTPWAWKTGMFEAIHLFSQYGHENFVPSNSSDEEFVSVYPMANAANDSMTIFLVNRSTSQTKNLLVDITGLNVKNGKYKTYLLSQLPQSETFISHTQNALKESEINIAFNKTNLPLEPLSVMAICLASTDEEYRNVSFKVYGESNGSAKVLDQAFVNIDGDSVLTNTNGEVSVSLTPGPHSVIFSKNGYYPKEIQPAIFSDTIITETLLRKTFDVTFTIKDKETGDLVSNCRITSEGQQKFSGAGGQATFEGLPAQFSVTLTKEYFKDTLYPDIQILTDTTLTLFIEPIKYKVDFSVLNKYTGIGILGAKVKIGTDSLATNSSGKVNFRLRHGNFIVQIEDDYFSGLTDQISITSDTSLVYSLSPTLADVKFRLKRGTTPVNKANISIGDTTIVTNSIGIASFTGLKTSAYYAFSIDKEGYNSLSGEFYLSKDTTIDVSMAQTGLSELFSQVEPTLEIWPNPTHDYLNIRCKSGQQNIRISILNLLGAELKSLQAKPDETVTIEMNEFSPGIYIIHTFTEELKITKYFVRD